MHVLAASVRWCGPDPTSPRQVNQAPQINSFTLNSTMSTAWNNRDDARGGTSCFSLVARVFWVAIHSQPPFGCVLPDREPREAREAREPRERREPREPRRDAGSMLDASDEIETNWDTVVDRCVARSCRRAEEPIPSFDVMPGLNSPSPMVCVCVFGQFRQHEPQGGIVARHLRLRL